jgi:class 3 adenylate cyclase
LHFTSLQTINNYFEMIVSEVIRYGGDVLKFAGDAIFAEWPVIDTSSIPSNCKSLGSYESISLEQCAATAALCATSIVKLCNDYPVIVSSGVTREAGISNIVGTLNVHCGVGVGCVAAIHVGDDTYRRELLLVGDPIEQVRFDTKKHLALHLSTCSIPIFNL